MHLLRYFHRPAQDGGNELVVNYAASVPQLRNRPIRPIPLPHTSQGNIKVVLWLKPTRERASVERNG